MYNIYILYILYYTLLHIATLDMYFTMLSYLRIGLYIRNDL